MTITARVILDSYNPVAGTRLTTLQLKYPRFIHSELMTHRVFSRNASSSRAIPVAKIIGDLENELVIPVSWGKNQKGMQANEDVTPEIAAKAELVWRRGSEAAIVTAKALMELGIHKQLANRVLEPWAHISVIVTSTEWANFFALRDHPAAEPNFQLLAREMRTAIEGSNPRALAPGEWHLPYVHDSEIPAITAWAVADWAARQTELGHEFEAEENYTEWVCLMVSAARCARVSYNNHDGTSPSIDADMPLARQLYESQHMSPFEHQATPCAQCLGFHANFKGFLSFRFITEYHERIEQNAAMREKHMIQHLKAAGIEGVVGEQ